MKMPVRCRSSLAASPLVMSLSLGWSLASAACEVGELGDPLPDQPESCDAAFTFAELSPDAPDYESWRDLNAVVLSDGRWLFERDILIENEDWLRAEYLRRYRVQPRPLNQQTFRSLVACDSEQQDQVWSVSEKLDLTYCFGAFFTPGLEAEVTAAIRVATLEWEAAGDVNFIHVPDADCECMFTSDQAQGCTGRSTHARIRIREMTDAEHDESDAPARAALPRSETQEILFHSSAPDLAQEEIVRHARHELGHALGFKHEHLRFIQNELAGWCIESGEFRAVTDPDRNSVMGYGSCSGIDGLVFSPQNISSLDRKGLAYLYNLPRNEVPSFTSEAFDDVLWFTPRTAEYVLWRGSLGANPGSPIVFTPEVPTCSLLSACNDDSFFRIRPIPASVTEGRFADTVMYGPGAIPDSFLEHTQNGPLVTHAGEIDVHPFDLPLVGQFDGLDPQEEIWWVRPGDLTDPLGIVSGANTYIVSSGQDDGLGTSSDQHFQPVVGLWAERGSRRPNSQVIWYRQRDTSMRLAFQSSNGASIMEEAVAPACFFGGLVWPTPLRGDFDGDDEMEVLWVSPINNTSVLWRDTATMWGGGNIACSQVAQSFPLPTTFQHSKPFVGDFDGDGSDDVYWYTPEPFADVIWIDIGGPGGPDSISPIVSGTPDPLTGDFTPVVGDFNGDLCDDILWFSPDTDFEEVPFDPTGGQSPPVPHPGSSPLWRSNCDPPLFTGFTAEEPELVAPPGAYPVGYDPRSAPRRADLSPTVP